jgi:glyoxylase-like metal-dependent hydrolase (beta-lactamase superfamily II)
MEPVAPIAFTDNPFGMLHDGARALRADPGDASVVRRAPSRRLRLAAILVTPHHGDHAGGVDAWRARLDGPARARTAEGAEGAGAHGMGSSQAVAMFAALHEWENRF